MRFMKALKLVDVTDTPDVLRLAQEVARSGIPVMLEHDGQELAVLMPASKSGRRSGRTGASADEQDTLLNIIGIGESAEPTDVARRKHDYLAEAYEPTTP
jgi:hypothetical protein